MAEPAAKRPRLSMEDVLLELENNEDEPMMAGSDDEFDDILCTEKERDEWGGIDIEVAENPAMCPEPLLTHVEVSPHYSPTPLSSHTHSLPLVSGSREVPSGGSTSPATDNLTTLSGGSTLPPLTHPVTGGQKTSRSGNSTIPTLPPISVARGITDPLSRPLSDYFSLPLSNLVHALQTQLTLQSHAPAQSHSLTPVTPSLTSVTPSLTSVIPSGSHHCPLRPVQRSQPSHDSDRDDTSPDCWSTSLSPIDVAPFVQEVGPRVPIPQSEVEVFNLFFTDEVCSFIVEQTNLYAEEVIGEQYTNWERVSIEELRAYFGFMTLMGIVTEPAIDDYWRRDELHYSPIADKISRQRFRDIHRFLHFDNNQHLAQRGEVGYDRLGKVRTIMQVLQRKLLDLYQPHCENAIDEAMIRFQGRSSLKQYMPAKPVKRGIKVWCRADSHNGYMCEVQVYTGKGDDVEGGLGKRVVLDLARKLEGKKYHLYFDNFFCSVSLLATLLQRGLYACGTTRQNYKDFPTELRMNGKGKREMEKHGLFNR